MWNDCPSVPTYVNMCIQQYEEYNMHKTKKNNK